MTLRRSICGLLLLVAVTSGCGTTQILTDDPQARIYADGQMVGKGQGQLTRRGFPGSTTVVVATEDGRRGLAGSSASSRPPPSSSVCSRMASAW